GGDPQVFAINGVVGPDQPPGDCLVNILSLASHLLGLFGQQLPCRGAARAARLRSREPPLGLLEVFLSRARGARILHALAICGHEKDLQPDLHTSLATREGQRLERYLGARETDLAAIRLARARHRLAGAHNWAAPAHRHAAQLGEHPDPGVQSRPAAILVGGKGGGPSAPLKGRKAGVPARLHAAKERLGGAGEAGEHILHDRAVEGSRVRTCRAQVLPFGLVLEPRRVSAWSPSPPRDALLPGTMVQRTTPLHDPRTLPLLIRCGRERALIRRARRCGVHRTVFCLLADNPAIEPDVWLKPGRA